MEIVLLIVIIFVLGVLVGSFIARGKKPDTLGDFVIVTDETDGDTYFYVELNTSGWREYLLDHKTVLFNIRFKDIPRK